MIKYKKKAKIFINIDRNRTMIHDSRVGFLELKALSFKNKFESDKIDNIIAYMKPLMINATDRNITNIDNHQFFLVNFLLQKVLKFRRMF